MKLYGSLEKGTHTHADAETGGTLAATVLTGTLGVANGGTGITTVPTTGQVLIGQTAGTWTATTLTDGANILISEADGAITIGLTGTIAIANGGTGTTTAPSDGKLLIGKTDGSYAVATLTAGTNISIANGNGTATISTTGVISQYTHTQGSASATWTITHNLNEQHPIAIFYDSNHQIITPNTQVGTSTTVFTATFDSAITGYAKFI